MGTVVSHDLAPREVADWLPCIITRPVAIPLCAARRKLVTDDRMDDDAKNNNPRPRVLSSTSGGSFFFGSAFVVDELGP